MIFFTHVFLVGITVSFMVFAEIKDNADNHVKELFIAMLRNIIKGNKQKMEALKRVTNGQDSMVSQKKVFDKEPKDHSLEIDSNQNAVVAFLKMMHNNGTFRRMLKLNNESKSTNENLYITMTKNEINDKHSKLKENNNGKEMKLYSSANIKRQGKNTDGIGSKESKDSSSKKKALDLSHKSNADLTEDEEKISITVGGKKIDVSIDNIRRHWMDSCTKKAAKVCKKACYSSQRNSCSIYSCSKRAKRRLKLECKRSCKDKFQNNRFSDVE